MEYYESRTKRLLAEFDLAVGRVSDLFASRYGPSDAGAMVTEAREVYRTLIPDLPYVGGAQPLTQFVVATGWFLAMYRALSAQGRPVEEAGRLVYEVTEAYLRRYPGVARRLMRHMTFSRLYLARLRRRAQESQERRYPGAYVFLYVPGDGVTFDYGVDYLECASCTFLARQGAAELAPYLCTADYIYSEMFGWGLARTTTLAEGGDRCDFRFKRGGPTRVASSVLRLPPN
jgi:hypothetical protein